MTAAERTFGTITHLPAMGGARDVWAIAADPHVAIKLKRFFPRAAPGDAGALMLTDTPEVSADLEWLLTRWPMEMDPAAAQRLAGRSAEYSEARATVEKIMTGALTLDSAELLEPALPPRGPWQMVPADMVLTLGRVFCGDVLGLGKTFEGLMVLRHPEARPAVVVCPPHLQRQWLGQLGTFFPTLRGHIVKTTRVYDPSRARGSRGHDPHLLIISYSKLDAWSDYLTEAFDAGRLRTAIFDEAHELRRSESLKYKAAERICAAARYRMQLSGTPVFNYGGDIHTIMRLLDEDALGARDEFVREWGKDLGRGKVGVRDPRALGHHLRDQGLFVRRTRADVGMNEPGVERIPHEIDFDQGTLDKLMDEAVDLAELITSRAGTHEELFRARGDIDWKMRRATGLAKAPYVVAFVKMLLESTEKVVLWGWHRDVYELWMDKLADFNPVMYTGSESPRQKDLAAARFIGGDRLKSFVEADQRAGRIKPWETHDESRILIMSLRSGAGLDGLQAAANVMVFGELDWSPAMHDQCIGRLDRSGQEDRVLAYFLHMLDGSDPAVLEVLGVKSEQSDLIRDPDLPLFEKANDTTDRAMALAQTILARRRTRKAA